MNASKDEIPFLFDIPVRIIQRRRERLISEVLFVLTTPSLARRTGDRGHWSINVIEDDAKWLSEEIIKKGYDVTCRVFDATEPIRGALIRWMDPPIEDQEEFRTFLSMKNDGSMSNSSVYNIRGNRAQLKRRLELNGFHVLDNCEGTYRVALNDSN